MVKRGKGLLRESARRGEARSILVVSEGAVTERQYLERLRQHLMASGLAVSTLATQGVGKDPERVVKKAIELAGKRGPGEPFDEVWVLVDVDEHAHLEAALGAANANQFHVAVSNPCFEIWLIWHYESHTAWIGTAAACKKFQVMNGAGKHLAPSFPIANVSTAVARAQKTAAANSMGNNPSSAVHVLVESLWRPGQRGGEGGEP